MQSLRPHLWWCLAALVQALFNPLSAFVSKACVAPEVRQRGGNPKRGGDFVRIQSATKCDTYIVVLQMEARDPCRLLGALKSLLAPFDKVQEVVGMPYAIDLPLAARDEPLLRVLTHRLQESIAHRAIAGLEHH